jgi:hypothetical protein
MKCASRHIAGSDIAAWTVRVAITHVLVRDLAQDPLW